MAPKFLATIGLLALLCVAPALSHAQAADRGELAVFAQIKRLAQQVSLEQLDGFQQRREEWRNAPMGYSNSRLQLHHGGLELDWRGDAPSRFDGTLTGFRASHDFFAGPTCNGSQQAGVSAGSSFASGDSFARRRDGSNGQVGTNDLQSYFVGAYFSDLRNSGRYLDLQAKVAYLRVQTDTYRGASGDTHGVQLALAAEAGYDLALTERYGIEPQLQLLANYTNLAVIDAGRYAVDSDVTPELALRAGVRAYRSDRPHFAYANLWQILDGDDELYSSSAADLRHQRGARWMELGVGTRLLTLAMGDLSLDLRYRTSVDDHDWQGLRAGLGFSWAW
ncbi:autotransporter domain-containing protein [Microbulbifer zhoushanensis]|uniref:autotransporter domain-containing protein n=1 Tax=Microbulbifer zhoushanensis TaxID=2904254 RepID=UPI001F1B4A5C|nr:autotransporter domain-containing protein [Microbulbifer zhoushanensis]